MLAREPNRVRRKVLGWREWVALPTLGVPAVKAKVDTGARSSAIHAFDVEAFRRNGSRWVRFTVHPVQGDDVHAIQVEAELVEERTVRSSAGAEELRKVVRTDVQVGRNRFPIELTLTNRDTMGFRMLLGREAVRGRFVVDPGRSFVQGRPAVAAPTAAPAGDAAPAKDGADTVAAVPLPS